MIYEFKKTTINDTKAITVIIGTIMMVGIVVSISVAGYLYLSGIDYEDSVRDQKSILWLMITTTDYISQKRI